MGKNTSGPGQVRCKLLDNPAEKPNLLPGVMKQRGKRKKKSKRQKGSTDAVWDDKLFMRNRRPRGSQTLGFC